MCLTLQGVSTFICCLTKETDEKAIAGRTSGLIELGETVTWRAKHLGIYQKLTVKIIEFDRPNMFTDAMLDGAFKEMKHTHRFYPLETGTKMIDEFEFLSPFGFLGKVVDSLFLTKYMTDFLIKKNTELKHFAESGRWKEVIEH